MEFGEHATTHSLISVGSFIRGNNRTPDGPVFAKLKVSEKITEGMIGQDKTTHLVEFFRANFPNSDQNKKTFNP